MNSIANNGYQMRLKLFLISKVVTVDVLKSTDNSIYRCGVFKLVINNLTMFSLIYSFNLVGSYVYLNVLSIKI